MKKLVRFTRHPITRKTQDAYKRLALRYYDRLTEQAGNGRRACIAEHARALHVTVISLTRACRSAMDATPMEAARNIAMDWAYRQLREGAEPLAVSLAVGYDEYHNFAKQFKRVNGIPPSLVRKDR